MCKMDDVEMIQPEDEQNQIDNDENLKKKRIQVYKNILKYYQSKSLSLEIVLASKQPSVEFSNDEKNYKTLAKTVKGLHDDISFIQSLKDCVKLINNSLTCSEIMSLNDFNFKRDILNKIDGIIYFSKSIMKMYNESYNEADLIEKKKKYAMVFANYGKTLDEMKEKEENVDEGDSKTLKKAELQVYKINLIRAIKSVLIGYISVKHPDVLQQVHQFSSPMRRNLTIDDFNETWDVGLAKQTSTD